MTMNRDRFARALDGITVQPTDEQMLARIGPVPPRHHRGLVRRTSLAYVPRVVKLLRAIGDRGALLPA
jgi:hypothetical protein